MTTSTSPRPPLPPFDRDAAIQKVRLAEDAWNTRDPARVATGYTPDSVWRNRAEFLAGREAIVQFLARKWARELDYRLIIRSYGRFTRTGSRSDSPTSGATTVGTGSARTGTRTGSSTGTVSWLGGSRASTICRSTRRIASIGGLSAAVRTVIPVSPIWACRFKTWLACRDAKETA